ncbi:Uncharacterized protein SCG7109_AP_00100 [Chlamydiales bacterium SCGC AG-110-M15]|nr:Uncharacterized protein SCG7109_AP_00100 [Chlamydiales bacterium SCGC AG-110-M15]
MVKERWEESPTETNLMVDMMVAPDYDESFRNFVSDLASYSPDGIVGIDLNFLHSIGLLKCDEDPSGLMRSLTDYFHVEESPDKITLFNNRFVAWIVPKIIDGTPLTYTMIAVHDPDDLSVELEIVFSTEGIYNSPRLILKVLDYFLKDIEENENIIAQIS